MGETRIRVVVADDDPGTLAMVAEALRKLGADVTCAASGAELIERLASATFDLVVTDVAMPWMSGLQVAHSARTAGLVLPTLVITAMRDRKIAAQVRALGASVALLYKPFGLGELRDAITAVLARGPTEAP